MWKYLWNWIVRRRVQQKNIMHALSEPENIQGIGLLAEALKSRNASRLQTAENALIHLLPQLKATDRRLLNGHQRFCLHRYLKIDSPRPDLTMAILEAMKQVGDYADLSSVSQLAQAGAETRMQQRIVLAAQESLPLLRRRSNVGASKTLLRAANVPAPSETILHQLEEEG